MYRKDLVIKLLMRMGLPFRKAIWVRDILAVVSVFLFCLFLMFFRQHPEWLADRSGKNERENIEMNHGDGAAPDQPPREILIGQFENDQAAEEGAGSGEDDNRSQTQKENASGKNMIGKILLLSGVHKAILLLLFAIMIFFLYESNYLWIQCLIFGPVMFLSSCLQLPEYLFLFVFGIAVTLTGILTMRPQRERMKEEKRMTQGNIT